MRDQIKLSRIVTNIFGEEKEVYYSLPLAKRMDDILNTLTWQEAMVVVLRTSLKRAECAEILSVSPERITSIENKAYRKMRHPSRISLLDGHVK